MDTYDDITKKHMLTVKEMGILEDEIDISKDELKSISQELGMTEEGWNYVMQEADKKIELAQSHLKYKSYRECILTSEEALLLNPYIKGARGLKAKAFLLLAINEEDDSYLSQAEEQAKITLKKESRDKNALEVLATVSSKRSISLKEHKSNPNRKLILLSGVLLMIVLVGIGSYLFFNQGATNSEIENVEHQLSSAFEKQEALIPKVEALLGSGSTDTEDQIQLAAIKEKLTNTDLSLHDRYALEVELGELLSSIVYRKSNEQESTLLNDLRVLLEGAENRIKTERKNYNDAIVKFNSSTEKL